MNNDDQTMPAENETEIKTPETNAAPEPPSTPKKSVPKKMWLLVTALLLVIAGLVAYMLMNKDKAEPAQAATKTETQQTAEETKPDETKPAEKVAIDCKTQKLFADKDFGAAFCYPSEWGSASVMDAKIDNADTGHREAVRFSANTIFIVGGVSEDWTTTVGRDVGCQEPSNSVPALSDYDTEWHDIVGSGMAVEYAARSLAGSAGGYDMTESVSNLLQSGVCTQGHKTINGSRYKVISAAFSRDFSEAAGITSPKAHMDNPNVLFSEAQRTQFDALLASVIKY